VADTECFSISGISDPISAYGAARLATVALQVLAFDALATIALVAPTLPH
jgi:hypothetical protein